MIHLRTSGGRLEEPNILWRNVLLDGPVTVSSAAAGGAGANAFDGSTADFWVPTSLPASLSLDLVNPAYANALGMAAHTLGSNSATLIIEYLDGAAWTELATVVPADDTPFMVFFSLTLADQYRVRITGACDVPVVGVVMIGHTTVVPGGVDLPHTPLNLVEETEMLSGLSRRGQFLKNRVVRRGGETSIQFIVQTPDDVETYLEAFVEHYNIGDAFFFATAPSVFPRDMGLCWRPDGARSIQPTYRDPVFMMMSMQVRVYRG